MRKISPNGWVTVFISFASLVVSVRSCQISSGNEEIKAAVKDIATLAAQTKRQADATTQQLEYNRRLAEEAGSQTLAISEQTDAIKASSAAAITSARAQTKAADVATVTQRGAVALRAVDVMGLWSAGDAAGLVEISVSPQFINSGGSTIIHLPADLYIAFNDVFPNPITYNSRIRFGGNNFTVNPRETFNPSEPWKFNILKTLALAVISGKTNMYIFGEVKYADVFGETQHYCFAVRVIINGGGQSSVSPAGVPPYNCRAQ